MATASWEQRAASEFCVRLSISGFGKKRKISAYTSLVTTSHSPSLARMRNSRELSTTSSCRQSAVGVKSHNRVQRCCLYSTIHSRRPQISNPNALTLISGSATTYCFNSLSPNARETASTPPTRHVPAKFT